MGLTVQWKHHVCDIVVKTVQLLLPYSFARCHVGASNMPVPTCSSIKQVTKLEAQVAKLKAGSNAANGKVSKAEAQAAEAKVKAVEAKMKKETEVRVDSSSEASGLDPWDNDAFVRKQTTTDTAQIS